MADAPLTECAECGMACRPGEYHPFAACLMFLACKDGDRVRANLDAVVEHGRAIPSPPVAAPPATPVAPTDEEIESLLIKLGMKWAESSYWKIEDADLHPLVRAVLATWPQPQPAQPLTADQRQDLLAAAFFIACRNEPGATLKDVDAERIADLLTELSGFDLAHITAPSTPTPPEVAP